MQLTAKGAHACQLGVLLKSSLADKLIGGQTNIAEYTTGICYDTVAFIRYLKGARITPDELVATSGQDWRLKFKFAEVGKPWDGRTAIPKGVAIGFYRVKPETQRGVFHAAVAIGGTSIRGVNGGLLGAGWLLAPPPDLKKVLGARNTDGTFHYDGTTIRVYLSHL
jgi:hypothetical protein